ncbi:hypothetical protein DPMN_186846 [Dreissena polymorpha]|uniref:Uncharacterized protein n=1 Tax=Dreissena polymorpha TaxID=45954 RepID=A0A9D4I6X2_DREPO|nr:hypothetical protein DPMN_186846 [Dreissena polymorpha]
MVTTISQNCYEQMDPKPFRYSLEDLQLSITGANGTERVYMGYIKAAISVPNISEETFDVPVLVVPNTEYNINVPVIIGTNVIRHLHSLPLENLSKEWKSSFNGYVSGDEQRLSGFYEQIHCRTTTVRNYDNIRFRSKINTGFGRCY